MWNASYKNLILLIASEKNLGTKISIPNPDLLPLTIFFWHINVFQSIINQPVLWKFPANIWQKSKDKGKKSFKCLGESTSLQKVEKKVFGWIELSIQELFSQLLASCHRSRNMVHFRACAVIFGQKIMTMAATILLILQHSWHSIKHEIKNCVQVIYLIVKFSECTDLLHFKANSILYFFRNFLANKSVS